MDETTSVEKPRIEKTTYEGPGTIRIHQAEAFEAGTWLGRKQAFAELAGRWLEGAHGTPARRALLWTRCAAECSWRKCSAPGPPPRRRYFAGDCSSPASRDSSLRSVSASVSFWLLSPSIVRCCCCTWFSSMALTLS